MLSEVNNESVCMKPKGIGRWGRDMREGVSARIGNYSPTQFTAYVVRAACVIVVLCWL